MGIEQKTGIWGFFKDFWNDAVNVPGGKKCFKTGRKGNGKGEKGDKRGGRGGEMGGKRGIKGKRE